MHTLTRPNIPLRGLSRDLLFAVLTALAFSLFIYAAHWDMSWQWLNSLMGLGAFFALLILGRRAVVFSGFFIGLLWFYWIGFSFQYYGMTWAVPLVALGFGLIYSLFFGVLALSKEVWVRALLLFALSFFEPMDFNWMQVELVFIDSYFGIEKWQFALILTALSLFATLQKPWRYLPLLLLIGAVQFPVPEKKLPQLDIKLVSTALPQELKWLPQMRQEIIRHNFDAVDGAVAGGYELVVLPESAFPLYLNDHPDIIDRLKEMSYAITIATGSLFRENGLNYNVTYLFSEGEVTVAKKMVLVPFGEYIPLPGFIREWINQAIFGGASDFVTATEPSDFNVNGTTFRNAICYEATCKELYEDDPSYLIAISNNGWFYPSIEPTLQRLLMQFYARKHNTVIFHAANMGGTGVIQ